MSQNMPVAEEIESPSKVTKRIEIFDFFFVIFYMVICIGLKSMISERLSIPFLIFSFLMAICLTSRSLSTKNRRKSESLYFLLTRDRAVYRPFISEEDEDETAMG